MGATLLGLAILPFVLCGIFRYLYLEPQNGVGGPDAAQRFTGRLLAGTAVCTVSVALILYTPLER